jgi:hypothetical protein
VVASRRKNKKESPVDPHLPVKYKKPGRPNIITPALADEICFLIASGETLRGVAAREHMPDITTILRTATSSNTMFEWFRHQYARALEIRLHLWAEETIEIADDIKGDYYPVTNKYGLKELVFCNEHFRRAQLKIDTRKWHLTKLMPKFKEVKEPERAQASVSEVEVKPEAYEQEIYVNKFLPKPEK